MIDNFARLLGYLVMGCAGAFCVAYLCNEAMKAIMQEVMNARNLAWLRRAATHYRNIEPMPKDLKNENS